MSTKNRLQFVTLLILTMMALPSLMPRNARAADGDLDPTFGTGGPTVPAGVARTFFGADSMAFSDAVTGLGIQSVGGNAGKIVAGGFTNSSSAIDFAMARYTTSGTLDTTFGPGMTGKVTTSFNDFDQSNDLALFPGSDKIVLVGSTTLPNGVNPCTSINNDFAIAVYDANGNLDAGFNGTGKLTFDFFGCNDAPLSVLVQPDNKILVVGFSIEDLGMSGSNVYLVMVRLNPDGTFDSTFDGDGNTDGKVLHNINTTGLGFPGDVVRIPSGGDAGKFILVGTSGPGDFLVARFNDDGSLDTSFGPGTGKVTTDFAAMATDSANSVALQPDGKIIAAGTTNSTNFAMARYDSDGVLDTNADSDPGVVFGTGGKVITDFPTMIDPISSDMGKWVGLLSSGKIMMVGFVSQFNAFTNNIGLARYTSNGVLDTTFGPNMDGKIITHLGQNTTTMTNNAVIPNTAAFQPDGNLLVAGQLNTSTVNDTDFFVARFGNTDLQCTLTCPANITVTNTANQCGANVKYPDPTESGAACTGMITCAPASGSFFPVGTTTVTCSDSAGPSCSFTVTVTDTQNPTVTCPANISTGESSPGSGSNTVTYTVPTPSDNCPGATTSCSPPSGSAFSVGTTTVTCTATDASANTGTCTFTVTVNPCVLTCPSNVTTVNDSNQCGAVVNYPPPTSTGTCGTITCSPASGSFFPRGTTTVSCTSSAGPGCSFTVTVNDTQPPAIACPANVTAVTPQNACAAVPGCVVVNYPAPVASDNCPGVTAACSPASGSCFPVGATTVTCTATDASSNTATCSFTVTAFDVCVQDDSNPNTSLSFNSVTGEYRICCNGTTLTGTGKVTRQGCIVILEHNPSDRRVLGKVDRSIFKGSGSLQFGAGVIKCTITDRDIRNNTCTCI